MADIFLRTENVVNVGSHYVRLEPYTGPNGTKPIVALYNQNNDEFGWTSLIAFCAQLVEYNCGRNEVLRISSSSVITHSTANNRYELICGAGFSWAVMRYP